MIISNLPTDTLYTAEKALMVYDYEPERALLIIDSAVIVGNVSDWWADKHRALIIALRRSPGGIRFVAV